uniref:Uncharacterized protein n=1 Tax=Arundo donax TaxID=35708 RepID=A0A0A9GM85_ARUDO
MYNLSSMLLSPQKLSLSQIRSFTKFTGMGELE